MDRDAPSTAPPPSDAVPPVPWDTVRKVGLAGAGMAAAAAALGLVATAAGDVNPWLVHTPRLALVFIAAVTSGLAVSWRPDLWQAWVLGAATAGLAVAGTPAHWDSFRLLFTVLAALALFRAGLAVVPPAWRVRVVSALIVLHFFGIFLATTAPNPTPWLTDQLYRRVYEPYLHFVYLRNAYHFYSPEPGPASLLVCLVKTEVGEEVSADGVRRKKYETKWVVHPRRPEDVKDPLGVTYYRRLSLTDQISRSALDMNAVTFEKSEVMQRRMLIAQPGADPQIPLHPSEPNLGQYNLADPIVSRYLLPSYAQHLLLQHTRTEDEAAKTTVKLYRVVHQTLNVYGFAGVGGSGAKPIDPYHPTTYRPIFLGEFGFVKGTTAADRPHVDLLDPQEPMLYWLVPIIPQTSPDPARPDYVDYLTIHALGSNFDPRKQFEWSKLR